MLLNTFTYVSSDCLNGFFARKLPFTLAARLFLTLALWCGAALHFLLASFARSIPFVLCVFVSISTYGAHDDRTTLPVGVDEFVLGVTRAEDLFYARATFEKLNRSFS